MSCRCLDLAERKNKEDRIQSRPQGLPDDRRRLWCRVDVGIKLEGRTRKTAFSRDLRACQRTAGNSDVVSMSGSSWKEEQWRPHSVENSGSARRPQATLMSCRCLGPWWTPRGDRLVDRRPDDGRTGDGGCAIVRRGRRWGRPLWWTLEAGRTRRRSRTPYSQGSD